MLLAIALRSVQHHEFVCYFETLLFENPPVPKTVTNRCRRHRELRIHTASTYCASRRASRLFIRSSLGFLILHRLGREWKNVAGHRANKQLSIPPKRKASCLVISRCKISLCPYLSLQPTTPASRSSHSVRPTCSSLRNMPHNRE